MKKVIFCLIFVLCVSSICGCEQPDSFETFFGESFLDKKETINK